MSLFHCLALSLSLDVVHDTFMLLKVLLRRYFLTPSVHNTQFFKEKSYFIYTFTHKCGFNSLCYVLYPHTNNTDSRCEDGRSSGRLGDAGRGEGDGGIPTEHGRQEGHSDAARSPLRTTLEHPRV